MISINAEGIHYRELNRMIREQSIVNKMISITNVQGQRYIGDGIRDSELTIKLYGTPGNDMAAFMDGPTILVNGNGQDAVGNTMNQGHIVIDGMAGDTVGYAMRGGSIYIKGDVGYRVGIHMKQYQQKIPTIVIGGCAGDFFGEYMAGGILVLLGLDIGEEPIVGDFCGTGMHGGVMYIRGDVDPEQLGREVKIVPMTDEDYERLSVLVKQFCDYFGKDYDEIMSKPINKLIPWNTRPYGKLYAY